MLSCFPRWRMVVAISYGCIGRSWRQASTASASGLVRFDFAIGYSRQNTRWRLDCKGALRLPHAPPNGVGGTGRLPCARLRADGFHGGVAYLTRQRLRAAIAAGVLVAVLAGGAIAYADGQLD